MRITTGEGPSLITGVDDNDKLNIDRTAAVCFEPKSDEDALELIAFIKRYMDTSDMGRSEIVWR